MIRFRTAYAGIASLALMLLATHAQAKRGSNVCATLPALHASADLRVPFDVVDGRIHVQARVNGKGPYRFAVDTGASGLGRADSSLVAALGLPITHTAPNSDGVKTAAANVTRFDSLQLGGYALRDLDVITRDYNRGATPALSGIIARAFFADGLLLIDYPTRTLSFSKTKRLDPVRRDVVPYDRPFRVPVSIGKHKVEGNLDTGANVSFILPQALFDKIGGGKARAAGDGSLSNTVIKTSIARMRGPFRIGAAKVSDVDVRISDRFPELLIGAHVLQAYAVLIDQQTKRIALCPPARKK
jgi:predicted aspartyl protease